VTGVHVHDVGDRCAHCGVFYSPNKFIFHCHRTPESKYRHPDAANFNSWRRHLHLDHMDSSLSSPGVPACDSDALINAWEDVKAMFNGGSRKRYQSAASPSSSVTSPPPRNFSPSSPRSCDGDNSAAIITSTATATAAIGNSGNTAGKSLHDDTNKRSHQVLISMQFPVELHLTIALE
jgi:hypothetical protein